VILTLVLLAQPASAHNSYDRDDTCGGTSNWFFVSGPAISVHTHATPLAGNSCHMWVYTVCATCDIVHIANWYLPTTNANGNYRVEMWIADDSHCGTQNARYQRLPYGTGGGVYETYPINQLGNHGKFKCITCEGGPPNNDYFQGSSGGYMRLVDRSNDNSQPVCYDLMRYEAIH
jgi:hypothetical protein